MLSLQEIAAKTKPYQHAVAQTMDSWAQFHPTLESPNHEPIGLDATPLLTPADRQAIRETLNAFTVQEFLAKSGTTGIAGGAYLVPQKIHDDLVYKAGITDLCPLIGHVVTGWPGGDLLVDIVSDHTYKPKEFTSGGKLETGTVEVTQATLAPISFGIAPRVTEDLIEDSSFAMVEYHLERAAVEMGDYATDLALTVLKTGTDGVGTVNSATSAGTDTTLWSEVVTGIKANQNDRFPPNTIVTTPESWYHSIKDFGDETAGGAAGDYWEFQQGYAVHPPAAGFDARIDMCDVKFSTSPKLHDSTDLEGAAFTTCVTLIFDRRNALLTGRKRWLQLNNYADPTRDLAGCTITARQDSVTLYNDSIYVLTEKT